MNKPGPDRRHRGANDKLHQKQGETPARSLSTFEKISAVEGIVLSREMKRDLETMSRGTMSDAERTDFIVGKYGRK